MSICILCGDDVPMDDAHDCRPESRLKRVPAPGVERCWVEACEGETLAFCGTEVDAWRCLQCNALTDDISRHTCGVYPYEYPTSEHSAQMSSARSLTDDELAQCMEEYLAHERFSRSEALRKAIEAADRIRGMR